MGNNNGKRVLANYKQRADGYAELTLRNKEAFPLGQRSQEAHPDDAMRATADSLIRIATKAFMRMHDVDYETAQRWIAGAAEAEAKNKKPAAKSRKAS